MSAFYGTPKEVMTEACNKLVAAAIDFNLPGIKATILSQETEYDFIVQITLQGKDGLVSSELLLETLKASLNLYDASWCRKIFAEALAKMEGFPFGKLAERYSEDHRQLLRTQLQIQRAVGDWLLGDVGPKG